MSFSKILKEDFMPDIQNKAKPIIKKERDEYSEIYKIIEEYCEQHEIIISDLYVLLNKKEDIKNIYKKSYSLYCANPLLHSNDLANIIHAKGGKLSKFTKLRTIKEKEEFIIEYNTRLIVTFYKVQRFKSNNKKSSFRSPNDIIKPTKIENLFYMPAEIEMIDIYHNLYDISKIDQYEASLEFEKEMFSQFIERKSILGSSDNCKERKKEFIEALKLSIVNEWLPEQENTVLIGIWAYNWLTLGENICTDLEKIQVISEMDQNQLLASLQKYVSKFSKFQITIREQELHIPKDFRTKRFTYYINSSSEKGTTEKPFLDLFNCANFELIPYTKIQHGETHINIGNKYVILRFLFIDLWIIRLIKNMGLLTTEILQKKVDRITSIIDKIRDVLGEKIQDANFIGVYKDYDQSKKIDSINQIKKFYPYYPEIYKNEKKAYRHIGGDED